ncbi:hypothetical protein CVT26_006514 [Gymnopilus dilepis]|uniref:Uncharacterized protein n=1 Tax=Gymnopilus dilepis TaxID=231916 RepID=A0A409Y3E7_9AGAR|nr:hypothetical protein CVT26_006514 [Gymnopilus dilepis]
MPPASPSPPSRPICAQEDKQEAWWGPELRPPTLSRKRRDHLPRIEERVGGGCSALLRPAAAPTLLA